MKPAGINRRAVFLAAFETRAGFLVADHLEDQLGVGSDLQHQTVHSVEC